jgi:flagellar hook-length control protein FliK
MERTQPKGDKTEPSKTALLQAALAGAEQVSDEKSATKPLPLPALTGQTGSDGKNAPDGVHQAVLAALGNKAAVENRQNATSTSGPSAEWIAQTAKENQADGGEPSAKATEADGKQAGQSKAAAAKQADQSKAAATKQAEQSKANTVQAETGETGKSASADNKEASVDATQAIKGEATGSKDSQPGQPTVAGNQGTVGLQNTAQQPGGRNLTDREGQGDNQGRFTLKQAAAATENESGKAAGATLNSTNQSFEATVESVSQNASAVTASTTPSIATAATAAQGAAQGAQAESAGELSPTDQVFAQMRANLRGPGDSITIRLDPPELGTVRISLEMDTDGLRAQLRASNSQTLGDLQRDAQTLINRLTEAGIQVRRVDVQPTEQSGDRPMHDSAEGQSDNGTASQQAQDQSGQAPSRQGRDAESNPAGENASDGQTATQQDEDSTPHAPSGDGADGSINVMM